MPTVRMADFNGTYERVGCSSAPALTRITSQRPAQTFSEHDAAHPASSSWCARYLGLPPNTNMTSREHWYHASLHFSWRPVTSGGQISFMHTHAPTEGRRAPSECDRPVFQARRPRLASLMRCRRSCSASDRPAHRPLGPALWDGSGAPAAELISGARPASPHTARPCSVELSSTWPGPAVGRPSPASNRPLVNSDGACVPGRAGSPSGAAHACLLN